MRFRGRGRTAAVLALAAVMTLGACGSSDDGRDRGFPGTSEDPGADGSDAQASDVTDNTELMVRVTSCAQIEAAVAPYIEGLVPGPDNGVTEFGAVCDWVAPEGITDFSQIRSVEVLVGPGDVPPDPADLAGSGLTVVENATIRQAGGVAFTMTGATAVAAVIPTTVVLPGAEVSVVGGQWGDYPALDGPAAVEVAIAILGLG